MSIIWAIIVLVLLFKFTGFVLKICGTILGGAISLLLYLVCGVFSVVLFGGTLLLLPLLLVIGMISLLYCAF